MNRRGFLKGFSYLAALSAVPKGTLAVTDFIEKKSDYPIAYNPNGGIKFENEMTILRKSVTITSGAKTKMVHFKHEGNDIWFVPHPMFDKI